jgi:hypothetical protein
MACGSLCRVFAVCSDVSYHHVGRVSRRRERLCPPTMGSFGNIEDKNTVLEVRLNANK